MSFAASRSSRLRYGERGARGPPKVKEASIPDTRDSPRLPPRWFIRLFWHAHLGLYRITPGRIGLWRPKSTKWGTLRLTTTGRRTGRPRSVIVGYFEDGSNLVAMAMNGWGKEEPAWWLNLQAHPNARIDLVDGPRLVRAYAASGDERVRLWIGGARSTPSWTPMRRCVPPRRLWWYWNHSPVRTGEISCVSYPQGMDDLREVIRQTDVASESALLSPLGSEVACWGTRLIVRFRWSPTVRRRSLRCL
jgi:deazaflavin-dependent oxidoreductase (nitroreductase family)